VVVWRSFHDAGIASLLLAPNPRPQDAVWSVIAGASGFVPGLITPSTITDTLLHIAGGNTALPAEVIGLLTDMPGAHWRLNLDESERRLLSAILARQTTQQMALQLHLSPEDVFAGLVGICEKVSR
jgi:DNA-binding NarL/FixJ family response regulator